MAVEGTLDLFSVPEVLQLIAQQQKTGILTIQGQQDIIAVSFLNGRIVAADALNQTQEEGLSQILVSERLLTTAEAARAVAEHQAAGGRLLDLLVERNYVQRQDLLQALRIQTGRLLQQLLRWDKGEFKFYGGDEVSYEEGFVPISVEEVIVRGAESAPVAPRRPAVPPTPPAPPALTTPPAATGPRPVPVPPAPEERRPAPPAPHAPPAPDTATGTRPGLRVVRREGVPPGSPAGAALSVANAPEEPDTTVSGHFRKMKVDAVEETPRTPLVVPALAIGLALALAAALLFAPGAILLPFPWEKGEREAFAREERTSLYLKIDRAAKTHFLLEGRFPESLAQLRAAGFLSGRDLEDTQGHALQYTPGEESYTLQPLARGKPIQGTETSEAITGNFFLDPELLALPTESTTAPLVLLD
jgi:hypothetical protein